VCIGICIGVYMYRYRYMYMYMYRYICMKVGTYVLCLEDARVLVDISIVVMCFAMLVML